MEKPLQLWPSNLVCGKCRKMFGAIDLPKSQIFSLKVKCDCGQVNEYRGDAKE